MQIPDIVLDFTSWLSGHCAVIGANLTGDRAEGGDAIIIGAAVAAVFALTLLNLFHIALRIAYAITMLVWYRITLARKATPLGKDGELYRWTETDDEGGVMTYVGVYQSNDHNPRFFWLGNCSLDSHLALSGRATLEPVVMPFPNPLTYTATVKWAVLNADRLGADNDARAALHAIAVTCAFHDSSVFTVEDVVDALGWGHAHAEEVIERLLDAGLAEYGRESTYFLPVLFRRPPLAVVDPEPTTADDVEPDPVSCGPVCGPDTCNGQCPATAEPPVRLAAPGPAAEAMHAFADGATRKAE